MNGTGQDNFKSIKVMQRDLRDWDVKAFREPYFNGNAKREDNDDFTVSDLGGGEICLSNSNGLESLKFKKQSEFFSTLTSDDRCCRIYSEPDMKGNS